MAPISFDRCFTKNWEVLIIMCKVNDIKSFLDKLPPKDEKSINQIFYRGQNERTDNISPSVFRDSKKDKEDNIYIETLTECSHEFDRHMTHIDILSKMQHYGVPTRLLDITTNPLVALFFACNSNSNNVRNDNDSNDGVVYVIKSSEERIKAYDSDSVSILASLPRFSKKDKNKLKDLALKYSKNEAVESFNNSDEVVRRLLHEIKKEKPAFENIINPSDLLSDFIVIPQKNNPRIIRQNGAFILFGLTDNSVKCDSIIIPEESKEKIKDELSRLGISEAALFPELYKFGEYMQSKYTKK